MTLILIDYSPNAKIHTMIQTTIQYQNSVLIPQSNTQNTTKTAPFPIPEATELMHLVFPKLTQMCGFSGIKHLTYCCGFTGSLPSRTII